MEKPRVQDFGDSEDEDTWTFYAETINAGFNMAHRNWAGTFDQYFNSVIGLYNGLINLQNKIMPENLQALPFDEVDMEQALVDMAPKQFGYQTPKLDEQGNPVLDETGQFHELEYVTGSEYFQRKMDENYKRAWENNKRFGEAIEVSLARGDYSTAGKNVLGGLFTSAPSSLIIALTQGFNPLLRGTLMTNFFAAGAKKDREAEGLSVGGGMDGVVDMANGLAEYIFEQVFGVGAFVGAIKESIKRQGIKAARPTIRLLLEGRWAELIAKTPGLAMLSEGIDELFTQITQNFIDKYSGLRPDTRVFEKALDAVVQGVTMGGVYAAPLTVMNKVMKYTGGGRHEALNRERRTRRERTGEVLLATTKDGQTSVSPFSHRKKT